MKRLFLFINMVGLVFSLFAQEPEARMKEMRSTFQEEVRKVAEAYNQRLQEIAEDYVFALRNLSVKLKRDGDEAGAAAVRKEARRYFKALEAEPDPFAPVPELDEEYRVSTPEALRLEQETYVGRRTTCELDRNEQIESLGKKHAKALSDAAGSSAGDDAERLLKEMRRVQVAMQGKDFAVRSLREASAACLLQPKKPDLSKIKQRVAKGPVGFANLRPGILLTELPPAVQSFLRTPLEYDHDWPPEITKWKFEGFGNYAHDFSYYRLGGLPAELGMYAYPKTLRGYVRGTILAQNRNYKGQHLEWVGKAMSWRLEDSRDLVCRVAFRTRKPSTGETTGPAACVAVYSIDEGDKLIASLTTPMVKEETILFMAKHYSFNRMNIKWEGTKRKRGFTVPDHTPLRVAVGVVGHGKGEEIEATIEVLPSGNLEEE